MPRSSPTPEPVERREEEPVLPAVSGEDRDAGWGDDAEDGGRRGADWYRRERPPHHE